MIQQLSYIKVSTEMRKCVNGIFFSKNIQNKFVRERCGTKKMNPIFLNLKEKQKNKVYIGNSKLFFKSQRNFNQIDRIKEVGMRGSLRIRMVWTKPPDENCVDIY